MKFFKIITLLVCISIISACTKTGGGTAVGAATGGLVGSRFGKAPGNFLAIGVGMLAGAFVGHKIGTALDDKDRLSIAQSSQKALEFSPVGHAVEWRNPASGHYGHVAPVKTFKAADGRFCREFYQTAIIGGKEEKAYGKACRQPDGQWQMIND